MSACTLLAGETITTSIHHLSPIASTPNLHTMHSTTDPKSVRSSKDYAGRSKQVPCRASAGCTSLAVRPSFVCAVHLLPCPRHECTPSVSSHQSTLDCKLKALPILEPRPRSCTSCHVTLEPLVFPFTGSIHTRHTWPSYALPLQPDRCRLVNPQKIPQNAQWTMHIDLFARGHQVLLSLHAVLLTLITAPPAIQLS